MPQKALFRQYFQQQHNSKQAICISILKWMLYFCKIVTIHNIDNRPVNKSYNKIVERFCVNLDDSTIPMDIVTCWKLLFHFKIQILGVF